MFAYCLNCPVIFQDTLGAAACICLTDDTRIDYAPWRDSSSGGGGHQRNSSTPPADYGSVADKFYTVRAYRYLCNEDEQVVLNATCFAFYKGTLVVKIPAMGTSGLSIGIIFLGSDVSSPDVVQHEYGHTVQLEQVGLVDYLTCVGAPSMYFFRKTKQGKFTWDQYYDRPWELLADSFGNVTS